MGKLQIIMINNNNTDKKYWVKVRSISVALKKIMKKSTVDYTLTNAHKNKIYM